MDLIRTILDNLNRYLLPVWLVGGGMLPSSFSLRAANLEVIAPGGGDSARTDRWAGVGVCAHAAPGIVRPPAAEVVG